MVPRLMFPDAATAADALTFSRRAATLPDPAVRLVADGGVLALSTAVLAPRDLADPTPTVLAVRTVAVDPEVEADVVVDPTLVSVDGAALVLPSTGLRVPWAGIAPPRAGWSETGVVAASTVAAIAHAGVAEVAESLPASPGEDVARGIRSRVWSRPAADLGALPAGTAFAALALGFIVGGEEVRMLRSGPWRRLTLIRGHVLVRGPVAQGLTEVRTTGR